MEANEVIDKEPEDYSIYRTVYTTGTTLASMRLRGEGTALSCTIMMEEGEYHRGDPIRWQNTDRMTYGDPH